VTYVDQEGTFRYFMDIAKMGIVYPDHTGLSC
jgi:hypothetical protein